MPSMSSRGGAASASPRSATRACPTARGASAMAKPRGGTAVLIGSFPIYHNGHHELMREALSRAHSVIVVLGSAFHARTPRDPFTAEERTAMIRLALEEEDRGRVRFAPLRDYYDDARWAAAVKAAVEAQRPELPLTLVLGTGD